MLFRSNGGDLAGKCFVGDYNNSGAWDCFFKYFKVAKDCGTGTGCFYDNGIGDYSSYSYLTNGERLPFYDLDRDPSYKVTLTNGMSILLQNFNEDCSYESVNYCAGIYFDINGVKPPNMLGRDLFTLDIKRNGVYIFSYIDYPNTCVLETGDNGFCCLSRLVQERKMGY